MQGKRSDIDDATSLIKEQMSAGKTVQQALRAVAETHPSLYAKMPRGLLAYANIIERGPPAKELVWRQWQRKLIKIIDGPANDREIVWVYDANGGAGKSTLLRRYCSGNDELKLGVALSGKLTDMAYAYAGVKAGVVFFDMARSQADNSDHLAVFAEWLKNGNFMSTKYESRFVTFDPPHVVFLSNSPPPEGRWSSDRLRLITITKQHLVMPGGLPVDDDSEVERFVAAREDNAAYRDDAFVAATTLKAVAPTPNAPNIPCAGHCPFAQGAQAYDYCTCHVVVPAVRKRRRSEASDMGGDSLGAIKRRLGFKYPTEDAQDDGNASSDSEEEGDDCDENDSE